MRFTEVDQRKVFYMSKTSDRIHIKFDEWIYQGDLMHPAGELICKAVTEAEEKQYLRDYGLDASDAILSASITKYGTLFWDEGTYILPVHNANISS